MSNDKYERLVRSLHARTVEGQVPWKQTSDEELFQASFRSNSIQIMKVATEGTMPDYFIYLLGPTGEVADMFSDVQLDKANTTITRELKYYNLMGELHTMARRSALGADKIIDSILSQIEDPF